jgi:uncharacterized repeat protein (TIGR02543 family)
VDGPASSNAVDDVDSITVSHHTGDGVDRLLLVGISWNGNTAARAITSATFTPSGQSAVPLTLVKLQQAGTQYRYSAIYSLLDPPGDVDGTVTITFDGAVASGVVAGVVNFAGVNQTIPLGAPVGAYPASNGTDNPSVQLTGLSGTELVFDNVFMGGTDSSQTLARDGGLPMLWNAFIGNTRAAATAEQVTGSSVTTSWKAASTGWWAIAAVAINPAGPTHDLTMAASGGGSITPAAGTRTYLEGQVVGISATPDPGWTFAGWTGEGIADPGAASTTVTMDADRSVTAVFTQDEYTLTVNTNGQGSVTRSPEQVTYHYGDTVQLTAIPDSGWDFASWSGDLTGSVNPGTVTMNGNRTVTAGFQAHVARPIVDGTPTSGTGAANASSLSLTPTVGSGANRLLLVGVSWNCGSTNRTISSVTFNGSPMSPVITQQAGTQLRYSAIYSLVNPPSGAGTVAISFSGTVASGIVAGAVSFAGVDQTTPLGTPVGAFSPDNTTKNTSVSLTGLSGNELVFDNVFFGGGSSITLAANTPQTPLWNAYVSSTRGAASTQPATGAAVTMGWTGTGTAAYWSVAAVPVKPAL